MLLGLSDNKFVDVYTYPIMSVDVYRGGRKLDRMITQD